MTTQTFEFSGRQLIVDDVKRQIIFKDDRRRFIFNLLETDTDGREHILYHSGEVVCRVSQYGADNFKAWCGRMANDGYESNSAIRAAAMHVYDQCNEWFRR